MNYQLIFVKIGERSFIVMIQFASKTLFKELILMVAKNVYTTAAVRMFYIFNTLVTDIKFFPALRYLRSVVGFIARTGEKLISGEMVIRYAAYRMHYIRKLSSYASFPNYKHIFERHVFDVQDLNKRYIIGH